MPHIARTPSLRERLRLHLDERTGLRRLWAGLGSHRVPAKLPWYYYLGGLLLLLFSVQAVTGVLLLLYYQPSPATAHQSIEQIMGEVRFGWIVRSLHYWSSQGIVVLLLLHLGRVFITASFKRPRELTWMLGVGLLLVMLGFAFTGYLLPWDQTAFWGTTVGTNIGGQTPLIGSVVKALMRGGRQVGAATLERFFALHVIVLPALIVALLGAHLALVWKHGPSQPLSARGAPIDASGKAAEQQTVRFFPVQARQEAALACFVLAALLLWVAWLPAPLGEPADPLITPENIKPQWYFLFSYQALKYIPPLTLAGGITLIQLAVLLHGLPLLLLLLWPYLERSPRRHWRQRRLALLLAGLALFVVLLLTYLGVYAGGSEPLLGIAIS